MNRSRSEQTPLRKTRRAFAVGRKNMALDAIIAEGPPELRNKRLSSIKHELESQSTERIKWRLQSDLHNQLRPVLRLASNTNGKATNMIAPLGSGTAAAAVGTSVKI